MPDTFMMIDEGANRGLKKKLRDNGDNTFAEVMYVEPPRSADVVNTQFTHTVLATLLTNVNNYLAGSNKKFLSVSHYALGVNFYTIITERN